MKIVRIMKGLFLALLATLVISSGAAIWASEPTEKCVENSSGGCTNNGCGGVCGQPAIKTQAFDSCWCLS